MSSELELEAVRKATRLANRFKRSFAIVCGQKRKDVKVVRLSASAYHQYNVLEVVNGGPANGLSSVHDKAN